MSNCSFEAVDSLMVSLQLVIYIPIFIFGLVLNTAALVVFCFVLRKWTESSIYMTNLVLMDLLILFPLPFKMHATRHRWAPDKRPFCSFLESLYFVSVYGSIYTIVGIAVDRYVAIRHPFRAKQLRSPRAALLTCALIWALVLGASAPVHSFHSQEDGDFRCFHGFSRAGWSPPLIACLQVLGFLGPALVLVVCSALVIRTLHRSMRPDHPHSEQSHARSQACARIIYSNLCIFLVPFTPCHLAIFLQFLVRNDVITDCRQQNNISLFVQVAMSLSNITCCLDACCYYFITREIHASGDSPGPSCTQRGVSSTSEL
ncbi:G-protein coupled receptor 55 [Conger conger]|uniref:G-protein coupled receptor 55 n=1 Tax=Conger conger TaxID=82655 RepID=UPI002A5A5258|nr:G-protein coupled receptor 55 [Conger conger]